MGFFDWLNNTTKDTPVPEVVQSIELDFSNFNHITEYIYEKSGITDLDKRSLSTSNLQQYAISEHIFTTNELLIEMKNNPLFYQEVINIATVNETFFFREKKELDWLVEYIKNSQKNLNILSMPCSSGEEIYSILLLMSMQNIPLDKVKITGYDINSLAVAHAKDGKYDEHSLHKLDIQTKEKYFLQNTNNNYEISSHLKTNLTFIQKNIFDLVGQKEQYDIVLSRNMFIYFDSEKRKLATDIIAKLLKTDGIYIKGHADHINKHPYLKKIHYGVYKKSI